MWDLSVSFCQARTKRPLEFSSLRPSESPGEEQIPTAQVETDKQHPSVDLALQCTATPPVPTPQLGTAHVFLACARERGHGTVPALLRGSQGLLETHDGHLAAVSEPTAWAGRGGCWHMEAATGEVGTGGACCILSHALWHPGGRFFFFWQENPAALLLLFSQAVPASLNCK